jgi:hypothetical protein
VYKLPQIRRWCTTRGVEFPAELKKVGPARIWFVNIVTDYKKLFSYYSEDEIFRYIQDKITAELNEDIQKMTSTNRQDWFDTYVESQKKHPPEVPTTFDVESIRKAWSEWNHTRISKYITGTDRPYCSRKDVLSLTQPTT